MLLFNAIHGRRQGSHLEDEVALMELTKWCIVSGRQWAVAARRVHTRLTESWRTLMDSLRSVAEPCA